MSAAMGMTIKVPDIASASVSNTLAQFEVNPETGLTRAEVDAPGSYMATTK